MEQYGFGGQGEVATMGLLADETRIGGAVLRDAVELPFGTDMLTTHPGSAVEGLPMAKPTETATEWGGVPDSHNDD